MTDRTEKEQPLEWVDDSDPHWPRGVTREHLDADADHEAVGDDPGDGIFDNCKVCGLAVTSNGKRHGWDESSSDHRTA